MTATPAPKIDTGVLAGRSQTPRRLPLAELATRGSSIASPALGRVMPACAVVNVRVAGFQSFV
ncbi:FxSxx-COOH cyclophane-containing RiPP peptide [Streptomyces sp. NPDC005722]